MKAKTARFPFKFPSALLQVPHIALLTAVKDSQFPVGSLTRSTIHGERACVDGVVQDIMGLDRTLRAKELDFA